MKLRQEIEELLKNGRWEFYSPEVVAETIIHAFLKHLPEKMSMPLDNNDYEIGWNSYRNEVEEKLK